MLKKFGVERNEDFDFDEVREREREDGCEGGCLLTTIGNCYRIFLPFPLF